MPIGVQAVRDLPIDLSTRLEFVGKIEHHRVAMAIDIDDVAEPPPLRLYPLVDQVADKVAGMYEKFGNRGSSRYRDLVDLVIIVDASQDTDISTTELAAALDREEHRRAGLTLPPTMVDPGSDWATGYRKTAAQAGVSPVGLAEALEVVGIVINPALAAVVGRNGGPAADHM